MVLIQLSPFGGVVKVNFCKRWGGRTPWDATMADDNRRERLSRGPAGHHKAGNRWVSAKYWYRLCGDFERPPATLAMHRASSVAPTSTAYLLDFFFGTFLPSLRASESPMAIACFRLFTVLPLRPLLRVPSLRSCIAFSTFFEAPLEYFLAISFASCFH
jgi:hypothetical protein